MVSFILGENFFSLKLLGIWGGCIKIQLKNIQLKDKNIYNDFPDLNEIENKMIKKVIIDIPNDFFKKKERNNNKSEFNNCAIINEKERCKLQIEMNMDMK